MSGGPVERELDVPHCEDTLQFGKRIVSRDIFIFVTSLPTEKEKKKPLFCSPEYLKRLASYHTQLSRISVYRKPIQCL